MPKSVAERMSSLRARQRRAGLTTVTLVVPRDDTLQLTLWAKRRREQWTQGRAQSAWPAALAMRGGLGAARSAISSEDIRRLRELLEVTAVRLVIDRMTPRIAKRLRALAGQESAMDGDATARDLQRFHLMLGELSTDPTLHFLLRIALRVTEERSPFTLRPLKREGSHGLAHQAVARSHH